MISRKLQLLLEAVVAIESASCVHVCECMCALIHNNSSATLIICGGVSGENCAMRTACATLEFFWFVMTSLCPWARFHVKVAFCVTEVEKIVWCILRFIRLTCKEAFRLSFRKRVQNLSKRIGNIGNSLSVLMFYVSSLWFCGSSIV